MLICIAFVNKLVINVNVTFFFAFVKLINGYVVYKRKTHLTCKDFRIFVFFQKLRTNACRNIFLNLILINRLHKLSSSAILALCDFSFSLLAGVCFSELLCFLARNFFVPHFRLELPYKKQALRNGLQSVSEGLHYALCHYRVGNCCGAFQNV